MNNWMYKGLVIFGKITIMKTFVLGKISHIATVLPTPTLKKGNIFDDLNNNFIRGKTPERKTKNSFVPDILHNPKEVLGLGLQMPISFGLHLKFLFLDDTRRTQLGVPSTWKM